MNIFDKLFEFPLSNKNNIAVYMLLIVASLIIFSPFIFAFPNYYDEGIPQVAGYRISYGDIPHLDYWTIYSPGIPILIAIFYRILEIDIYLLSRLIDLFLELYYFLLV